MYRIRYWDSYGNAHSSGLMDYQTALIMLANMHSSQDAMLVKIGLEG